MVRSDRQGSEGNGGLVQQDVYTGDLVPQRLPMASGEVITPQTGIYHLYDGGSGNTKMVPRSYKCRYKQPISDPFVGVLQCAVLYHTPHRLQEKSSRAVQVLVRNYIQDFRWINRDPESNVAAKIRHVIGAETRLGMVSDYHQHGTTYSPQEIRVEKIQEGNKTMINQVEDINWVGL